MTTIKGKVSGICRPKINISNYTGNNKPQKGHFYWLSIHESMMMEYE